MHSLCNEYQAAVRQLRWHDYRMIFKEIPLTLGRLVSLDWLALKLNYTFMREICSAA